MYKNTVDAEKMLNSGRRMILALSCILGLFIYLWAKELFGPESGLLALFFWAFSSTFIAHGTIVSTDMALALFYFVTMYCFWKWWRNSFPAQKHKNIYTVMVGISMGMLFASKYSAVVILPVLALIIAWSWWRSIIHTNKILKQAIMASLIIIAVLFIVYQFNSLFIYYWIGMKKVITGVATGRSSFLMGQYRITGWKYYFPVAFILKTPIPFLMLLVAAVFSQRLRDEEKFLFLLLPALFYFTVSCFSKVQIGHRHIIPVYPFLFVWISGLYRKKFTMTVKTAGSVLLIWYCASAIKVHPWHLSYFNEIIGSPKNAYKYMTDSNVDWGQGLKELSKYLQKEGVPGIYLNYFGVGDPHYYKIQYYPIGFIDNISTEKGHRDGDNIDFKAQKKVLFAISATNLQATYYGDKTVFSWLKEIEPEAIIADSILVYDLSKHPQQYEILKAMLGPNK